MKKILWFLLIVMSFITILAGCGGNDDTIQICIVANEYYKEKAALEAATQPEILAADKEVYTSVHFIESPKSMEYTVKWYINDAEIKSETKKTQKDRQDTIVYELETEYVTTGKLKIEILYKDTVLLTKELPIK